MQPELRAFSLALPNVGKSKPASIEMIEMTTSNSIRVNAHLLGTFQCLPNLGRCITAYFRIITAINKKACLASLERNADKDTDNAI
jgi:hypothetical protein